MPGTFGPMAVQELWLYDNMLTHLEENVFSNLTEIRLLVLSRNRIQHISPGAFNGLVELEEISLHTNRLISIEAGIFKGLPKLANISIENNQIQHIPIKLLESVSRLNLLELQNNSLPNLPKEFLNSLSIVDNIILSQNPWRCDNDILPFRDWPGQFSEKVKKLTFVTCDTPLSLKGRNVKELMEDDIMVNHSLHTFPTKMTSALASDPTTVSEEIEDTSGGDSMDQSLSKDKIIIIVAIVCTAVIVSLIACVLWRRNKRGSQDLNRQRNTNSVI